MRVALVSANRERLPDAVVPLGLLYIEAAVRGRHQTRVLDLCFEDDPCDALVRMLAEYRPDVVGLGLRNLQNADYSGCEGNVAYYGRLIETIRSASSAKIVLGGGGFSVLPQQLMRILRPDFGIAGEGEEAFARLLDTLESKASVCEIPGILRLADGEVVVRPATGGFQDIDGLAVPDKSLADARYYADSGIDSIQTKRGCPLRCDYCTYPLIEGRSIRKRDPRAVVDEMFRALETRPAISHFFIVDSVFNLPPAHAKDICREMISRSWSTPWTCYANPIGFDRELADLMVAAGCAGVEVGSDSGVDEVLARLKKGFDSKRILDLHEHCKAAGLADCHSFILATRGESLDDVRRTLDFCAAMNPVAAIIGIWTDDVEAIDPVLAESRRILRRETEALVERKREEFPRWIVPSVGVNFDRRLFKILRKTGLQGPLWQHLPRLPGMRQRSRGTRRPWPEAPGTGAV